MRISVSDSDHTPAALTRGGTPGDRTGAGSARRRWRAAYETRPRRAVSACSTVGLTDEPSAGLPTPGVWGPVEDGMSSQYWFRELAEPGAHALPGGAAAAVAADVAHASAMHVRIPIRLDVAISDQAGW
jgi:hypothetical protein